MMIYRDGIYGKGDVWGWREGWEGEAGGLGKDQVVATRDGEWVR